MKIHTYEIVATKNNDIRIKYSVIFYVLERINKSGTGGLSAG